RPNFGRIVVKLIDSEKRGLLGPGELKSRASAMLKPAKSPWKPLLAYSTNVHRGESLAQIYRFLLDYTLPVKERVFGSQKAGLELRLGCGSARDLMKASAQEAFGGFLAEKGLVPFSINAYPLLNFHARRVKEQVFRPSWAESERSRWTTVIAEI